MPFDQPVILNDTPNQTVIATTAASNNDTRSSSIDYFTNNGDAGALSALLLATQQDVNEINQAIIIAAYCGHPKCLDLLLKQDKIDVNVKNSRGYTALQSAAMKGHLECLNLLLQQDKIDINAKSSCGYTALAYAIICEEQECVDLLLRQDKIKINATNPLGSTAVFDAVTIGNHQSLVSLAKTRKANIDRENLLGEQAIERAVRSRDRISIEILSQLTWTLFDASDEIHRMVFHIPGHFIKKSEENHELIRRILNDINIHVKKINVQGTLGIDVDSTSAVVCSIVKLFSQKEIKLEASEQALFETFITAAVHGNKECLTALDLSKIDFNGKDKYVYRAFVHAIKNRHLECAKILMDSAEMDIHAKNKYTQNIIPWTIALKDPEYLREVLDFLVSEQSYMLSEEELYFGIETAIVCGASECLDVLLSFFKDKVNVINNESLMMHMDGDSPFTLALLPKDYECAEVLYKYEQIDINAAHTSGGIPLLILCLSPESSESLKFLDLVLKSGRVHVDQINKSGRTALMVAAGCGNWQCVNMLLHAKADPHKKDKYGKTALDIASEYNQLECMELLQAKK